MAGTGQEVGASTAGDNKESKSSRKRVTRSPAAAERATMRPRLGGVGTRKGQDIEAKKSSVVRSKSGAVERNQPIEGEEHAGTRSASVAVPSAKAPNQEPAAAEGKGTMAAEDQERAHVPMTPLKPVRIVLKKILGEGVSETVWDAEWNNQNVAVKIGTCFAADWVLKRERTAYEDVALPQGTVIPRRLGSGWSSKGRRFLMLERIAGHTLDKVKITDALAAKAEAALSAVHRQGLVT